MRRYATSQRWPNGDRVHGAGSGGNRPHRIDAAEVSMACTHAADCPLFPKLKASLERWRVHYCDTDREWMNCARYNQSAAGRPVPIALLPNGKFVQALDVAPRPLVAPGGAATATLAAATVTAAPPQHPAERLLAVHPEARTHPRTSRPWWTRLFAALRGAR